MSLTTSAQWMYSSGASFYDHLIEQSIRIPSGAALKNDTVANTTRTYDSAKIFTYSFWTKLQGNAVHLISLNDTPAAGEFTILYNGANQFVVYSFGEFNGSTSALFRDFSAWYHVCLVMDTTQATAANRARLYINGTLYSLTAQPSQNLNVKAFTTATRGALGARYQDNGTINYQASNGSVLLAEFIYADGVKHEPTVFGEYKSGVWIPKDASSIAIGTNGYHLDFSDQTINTNITSNTGFGKDIRNNQPNPQWIAVGGLATHDGMDDTPTKNSCTLNPLNNNNTLSQSNLVAVTATNTNSAGTLAVSSGKWYYEALIVTAGGSFPFVGFALSSASFVGSTSSFVNGTSKWVGNGGLSNGDVVGLGIDLDTNTFYARINGATTTAWNGSTVTAGEYVPAISGVSSQIRVNFGQEGTFAGQITAGGNTDANGYGDFKYPVPSGYLALNSANLPEPAISPLRDEVPDDYFNTVLYSGNSSTQSVTGVGFQPNFLWLKSRTNTNSHVWVDSVRGSGSNGLLYLLSNSTGAEVDGGGVTSLDSDGFTLDSNAGTNGSGRNFVTWNWKAGGTAVSNTEGSITSSVSANTQAGFSIVTYTGNSSSTATVGHGLGVAPKVVAIKSRNASDNWQVSISNITGTTGDRVYFNLTQGISTDTTREPTKPSSSVITIGGFDNTNGRTYVAYCFAEVEGYSKFGSYTGNGSTNGTFVYTGFKPAWIIWKRNANAGWHILDSKRNTYNVADKLLYANVTATENTNASMDFLSNGFKIRTTQSDTNTNGNTYFFMAFAEMPTKYANAR